MALMLSKTYDALVAAGAPEEKARDAAEELAAYEDRFTRIGTDLTVLKADTTAFKWMVGVNLAATVAVLVKVLL